MLKYRKWEITFAVSYQKGWEKMESRTQVEKAQKRKASSFEALEKEMRFGVTTVLPSILSKAFCKVS